MVKCGYPIVRCTLCGFMFALIPPVENTAKIYADDQFFFTGHSRDSSGGHSWYDVLWQRKRPFYLARLARIGELRRPGRMLDIGCAAGYMLSAARRLGWDICGIEPSPVMRQRAREDLGCTVYESLDQARAAGERFDCVMMFEVIEHLEDPVTVMREVRELLAPQGLIALSTPNCEVAEAQAGLPLDIWFVPPAHVSYFGPATLIECLRLAGFETVALEGLEGHCKVLAGEIAMPRWLTTVLTPLRRGKRMMPHGAIGKLIRKVYTGRLDLYQRRTPAGLIRCDIMELYARRAD